MAPRAIALIPARAGSLRVPGKNVLPLAGHPLIAYTIAAAHESGVFDAVVVSTDSTEIAEIARRYGAEVPSLRPAELSTATSPDIDFVVHMLDVLARDGRTFDVFSLLRPTSPFRRGSTIVRAWEQLLALGKVADSIRAIEPCRQHPGKMWSVNGDLMEPLLAQPEDGTPYHSTPYQALPKVYVQNSSLEIAWAHVVAEGLGISGRRVAPFFTEGLEGFSIDYPDDVELAERWIANGEAELPYVEAVLV